MPQYTKPDSGHAYGVIKKVQQKVGGRYHFEFDPKDVSPKDVQKNNWKPQTIIIDHNKFLLFPKGTLSNYKNMAFGLPKNADDLSEAIKHTLLGKLLGVYIESENSKDAILQSIKEGSQRKTDALEMLGDGELSAQLVKKLTNLFMVDLKEAVVKSGKDKPSGFVSRTTKTAMPGG